jgi:hypothetical protein
MRVDIKIVVALCIVFVACKSNTGHRNLDAEKQSAIITDSCKNNIFYPLYSEDTVMIFDSIKINQECYLIDYKRKCVKQTKTVKHRILWTEIFEKKITLTESKSNGGYQLAFVGDSLVVDWVDKTEVNNREIKVWINNNLNIQDYSEYFEEYGSDLEQYADKTDNNCIVEVIPYQDENLFMVSYMLETYPNYIVKGPSFIISYTDKRIYPLSGPCTNSDANLFIANDKLYIHTYSNCCNCGVIVEQLFEYNNKKLTTIIENGAWST